MIADDMAVSPIRLLSLCAGVGGLDLGVRIARPDARCIAFVEREASAAASLVASMEAGRLHPAPIWSDLRTFDAGRWRGSVDCVISGDPCQGNSVAGKRLGDADDRWLLDRAIDVFDASGAHTFFRENVVGNIVGQLAIAIPALERLGCRVAAGIFSAAEVGASHRRERLFIMAHRPHVRHQRRRIAGRRRNGSADDGIVVDHPVRGRHGNANDAIRARRNGAFDAGGSMVNPESVGRREGWPEHDIRSGRNASASASGPMGDTDSQGLEGRRERPDQCGRERIVGTAGHILSTARHDRLFAPGPADPVWREIARDTPSLEPAVCRMAHGMAGRTERLRHCGNGVVPLAAAFAWRTLEARLAQASSGRTGEPV